MSACSRDSLVVVVVKKQDKVVVASISADAVAGDQYEKVASLELLPGAQYVHRYTLGNIHVAQD